MAGAGGGARGGGATAADLRGSPRRWVVLAVLCLSVMLIGLSYTILYVAVPDLVRELGATTSQVQWVVATYSIAFAGLVAAAGSLGDRFGRRRVLIIGLVVFGVASAAGAASQDVGQLVVARLCMGLGAALVMPGTLSTLAVVFPGPERVRAVGIWSGIGGVGFVFGPLIAGVLVTHFWWGSTLLFNVPVVVLMLVAVVAVVPESRDPGGTPLDLPGAALSVVAVAALVYVVVEAPAAGWALDVVVAGLACAAAVVGFVAWERRAAHPLIDVGVFRLAAFTAPALLIAVGNLAVYGTQFLVPQLLQLVEGEAPLLVGAALATTALWWSVFAFLAPRFVDRWGARRTMAGAMALTAAGLAVVATVGSGSSLAAVLVGLALVGVGMGVGTTPATSMLIDALPEAKAGVGSAMNDVTREVGGALGVAVMGSVLAAWYGWQVRSIDVAPGADADAVRSGLADALALASSEGGAGEAVARAASDAFTGGTRLAVAVAAVAVAAVAVLVATWLPRSPGTGRPAPSRG